MYSLPLVDRTTDGRFLVKAISNALGVDYELMELLQYEIDKHAYYYGKHFRYANELLVPYEDIDAALNQDLNAFSYLLESLEKIPNWELTAHSNKGSEPLFLSNAYFDWNTHLNKQGLKVIPPIWDYLTEGNDVETVIHNLCKLFRNICKLSPQVFFNRDCLEAFRLFFQVMERYLSHPVFAAIVVPFTLSPLERFAVRLFQRLGRPTILTLHSDIGNLPCWWQQMEIPVDYYAVFGVHQANQLVDSGLCPTKIIVTGHPYYPSYEFPKLRFSFDNILVITNSVGGAAQYKVPLYNNRGHLIEFLFRVETILKEFGIKQVRLRVHPSESPEFYSRFTDQSFYHLEDCPLKEAIDRSTLIVGGLSTVVMEAAAMGVGYAPMFPIEYVGAYYWGNYQVSPYDGTDPRVPIANTDDQLREILRNKRCMDPTFLPERFGASFRPERLAGALKESINGSARTNVYAFTIDQDKLDLKSVQDEIRQKKCSLVAEH